MRNRICMGIWGMTNLRDRFNINGFGEEMSVIDRIKAVGETEDVDGIELHVPTEIDDKNAGEIGKVLKDYNLQMVQLCGHTWTEKKYKFGALGDTDPKVRAAAVERVKWALDMGLRPTATTSPCKPTTWGFTTATWIPSAKSSITCTSTSTGPVSASSRSPSSRAPGS
jgi:L-rhamnose isomerase